jgi:hypothetical protein
LDTFETARNILAATIVDIENFLVLYKNDPEKAESILINLSTQEDGKRTDLQGELEKFEALTSHHSLNEIDYFSSIMEMLKEELV